MGLQILAPSVKYREKTDFGTEMPGIRCDGRQRFRTCCEENVVEYSLVLLGQPHQLARHREHQMEVGHR